MADAGAAGGGLVAGVSAPLPGWVAVVERACFGDSWGGLMAGERLWLLPEAGFARWSVVAAAAEAELLRIGVRPEARGQGVGARLLAGCEAALAGAGIRRLFLEVRAGNAAARALYAAGGWAPCGRRARYYPDGEDAILYRKELG
ncbi:MAG TPA: GNAT family N-acetyltransferase [Polyangia bacterium]